MGHRVGLLILLLAGTASALWYTTVTVQSGGDYTLTANQNGMGVVLDPGHVHTFHLTQDSSANNQQLNNVAYGIAAGDALSWGQVPTGSVKGTMPNALTWQTRPLTHRDTEGPSTFTEAGECHTGTVGFAQPIDPAAGASITLQGAPVSPGIHEQVDGLITHAFVGSANTVLFSECAVQPMVAPERSVVVTVYPPIS